MKKYLLILMVGFVGCNGGDAKEANRTKNINLFLQDGYKADAQIMIVDTCEYVVFTNEYSYEKFVVHSGNCHNPNHKKVNN